MPTDAQKAAEISRQAALRSLKEYTAKVHAGLTQALNFNKASIDRDMNNFKAILFSDAHKGSGDKADDFKVCRKNYHAALGYYLESGHTLILAGDNEELWECKPAEVMVYNKETLKLEAEFHKQGRYYRINGNHDGEWNRPDKIQKYLSPIFSPDGQNPLITYPSLIINLMQNQETPIRLFITHGHQGTDDSDRYSGLSKFFLRNFWRYIQWKPTTAPSNDSHLRGKHNIAMYGWAKVQKDMILIAGHTHRPVFASETHADLVEKELTAARNSNDEMMTAALRAELEYIRAEDSFTALSENGPMKPCYFNTGCCSYGDGDITGIEFYDGIIRLIRWPDDNGRPIQKIMRQAKLADIIQSLKS